MTANAQIKHQSPPQIALIGCGGWGRNIARNLYELKALAGVADLNHDAAKDFAKTFECKTLTINEIASTDSIDAVVIATTPPSHAELAIKMLNAGKAVYVEKPFALLTADAEAMLQAATKNQKPIMVGHLLRHHKAFLEVCRLVEDGAIGRLIHISSERLAAGRIRDTESVLYDFCPHDLSMIAALTGRATPDAVHCHGFSTITPNIHDSVTAHFKFKSGLTAGLRASWLNPIKRHMLTVIGDAGAIVFDDTKAWDEKLTLFNFKVAREGGRLNLERDQGTPLPLPESEPLKDEMADFINAIKHNQPPRTDGAEALHVQKLMSRMHEALDRGTTS